MSNNRLAVLEAALNQAEAACIAAEQHRDACERELCAACAAMVEAGMTDLVPIDITTQPSPSDQKQAVPKQAAPAPCGGKVGSDGDW